MPKPPPGFEWDEAKAAANWRKHGVSFADAQWFDFAGAFRREDPSDESGEERVKAIGRIRRTLHVLIFTYRAENIRVISLRKAEASERRKYFAAGGA